MGFEVSGILTLIQCMLEEQMVDSHVLDHSIWIIAPAVFWGDVELWSLPLCLLDREVQRLAARRQDQLLQAYRVSPNSRTYTFEPYARQQLSPTTSVSWAPLRLDMRLDNLRTPRQHQDRREDRGWARQSHRVAIHEPFRQGGQGRTPKFTPILGQSKDSSIASCHGTRDGFSLEESLHSR